MFDEIKFSVKKDKPVTLIIAEKDRKNNILEDNVVSSRSFC